jgi:hypothetical protein
VSTSTTAERIDEESTTSSTAATTTTARSTTTVYVATTAATGPDHPAWATAQCNDGTYSYAAHHQGACSHHGGVAVFYN